MGLDSKTKSFRFEGLAYSPQKPEKYAMTISVFEPSGTPRDPAAPFEDIGAGFPIARYELVVSESSSEQR